MIKMGSLISLYPGNSFRLPFFVDSRPFGYSESITYDGKDVVDSNPKNYCN